MGMTRYFAEIGYNAIHADRFLMAVVDGGQRAYWVRARDGGFYSHHYRGELRLDQRTEVFPEWAGYDPVIIPDMGL